MSEIEVRLPDGKTLSVPAGSTVLHVAERIGKGLARAALAGRVDGDLVDLRVPIRRNAEVQVVTTRCPEAGDVIRHSAEHVMADAVKRLFPEAQIDVGRVDHSEKFQYDFLVERPFTPEDLERITEEMGRIIDEKSAFVRDSLSREEAKALFKEQGEDLKLSRLDDIPDGEEITVFRHGDFSDLCRGPHVQRTDQIGAFKLTEAAACYWRGDERNPMLQRIYGTAFPTAKELDEHLAAIEESRRRDHRRVGVELDLFMLDPLSPGSPFYLPKGMVLYNTLVDYIRGLYPRYGYLEVMTPQIFRTEIFKTSGHYDLFREDMFLMQGDEGEELGVKPMNCPGHCILFANRKRSYRELPLRFAEFSRLHRNERSGTLTGLTRVRSMAQDDAHIYCETGQTEGEIASFFEMTEEVYEALGLSGVEVAVSTRAEGGFAGDPVDWDFAEEALIAAVRRAGYDCRIKPGDAAFYGPKVECDFRDVLGRPWTLSTLQIDVSMPARFGLEYVGRDGEMHRPAMLHRAILGSLERFIALYIEMTRGDFPFWLAPVQVLVLPISDRHLAYARQVEAKLSGTGIRVEVDGRSEKLGFKIREAEIQKIPVMLVVGDKEAEAGTVTPRRRHGSETLSDAVEVDVLAAELSNENEQRRAGRAS
jgi:threonyl-tRNA synthetase